MLKSLHVKAFGIMSSLKWLTLQLRRQGALLASYNGCSSCNGSLFRCRNIYVAVLSLRLRFLRRTPIAASACARAHIGEWASNGSVRRGGSGRCVNRVHPSLFTLATCKHPRPSYPYDTVRFAVGPTRFVRSRKRGGRQVRSSWSGQRVPDRPDSKVQLLGCRAERSNVPWHLQ